MAKAKKNTKCPLQDDCERKCTFEGFEIKCDFFSANLTPEIEEQAKKNGIVIPSFEESIDWNEISDDFDEEDDGSYDEDGYLVQTSGLNEDDTRDVVVTVGDSGAVQYLGGERGYTAKIQDAINRSRNEFMYIGMLLCEVEAYGYYTEAGFSNIYEYCETTFGFKRSSTNNFMRVYRVFGEAMGVKDAFKGYNYSQLTEMCCMSPSQLTMCKPEMSVQRLREIKRSKFAGPSVCSCLVQTSGLEIHCNQHSYQIPAWLVGKMLKLFGGFDRDKVFDALDAGLVSLYGCKKGYLEY